MIFAKYAFKAVCWLLLLSVIACSCAQAPSSTLAPVAPTYDTPEDRSNADAEVTTPEPVPTYDAVAEETYADAEVITPMPNPADSPVRPGHYEGYGIEFDVGADASISEFRLTVCQQLSTGERFPGAPVFTNAGRWPLVFDSQSGKWGAKATCKNDECTVTMVFITRTIAEGTYRVNCGQSNAGLGRGEWEANFVRYPATRREVLYHDLGV